MKKTTCSIGRLLFIVAALATITSCMNPLWESGESGESDRDGTGATATIHVGGVSGSSIIPDVDSLVDTYHVILSRSGYGDLSGTGSATVEIVDVALGVWDVSVEAVDADGAVVGIGSGTVDVTSGGGSATITVTPTAAGSGSLNITIDWSAAPGAISAVQHATLTPAGQSPGPSIHSAFSVSASSASYTNGSALSGQYTLVVRLEDGSGDHVATVVEAIHVYDNVETAGTINLTSGDIAQPPTAPAIQSASESPAGSGDVAVSWDDTSNVEERYLLSYSFDGGSTYSSPVDLGANATSYTFSGLDPETTYTLRVTAENSFGATEDTVEVTTGSVSVYYVSTSTGDNGNNGRQDAPLASISEALSRASSGDEVRVAGGEYDEVVNLEDGVDLYGGYDSGDWTRNIESNQTTIVNSGTADTWTLYGNATATVDGFTIRTYPESGSPVSGTQYAAIFFGGSPTISNSRLIGGADGGESRTIHMQGSSSPTIQNSYINISETSSSNVAIGFSFASGYSGTLTVESSEVELMPTGNTSYGVRTYSSSSGSIDISDTIFRTSESFDSESDVEAIRSFGFNQVALDSVIIDLRHGGSSQSAYGVAGEFTDLTVRNSSIRVEADRPWLFLVQGNDSETLIAENNSLYGLRTAAAGSAYGVYLLGNSLNATVRNNLVAMVEGAGDATTVAITTPSVNSADVSNNVFYNAGDSVEAAHHNDADGNLTFTSVAGLGLADPDGTDPDIADLSLTSSTAPTVTQGGLDLSGAFNGDITGSTRTAPWSIGAYEFDGAADAGSAEASITFDNPNDPDVSFSGAADGDSVSQGTDLTLTAPAGYSSYTWYLNGTEAPTTGISATDNSATVTTGDLALGTHSVALVVGDGANLYSAQVDITVVQ